MKERSHEEEENTEGVRPDEPDRSPFGYYYDDGTGYEVYRPEEDEADEEEADGAHGAGRPNE